MEVTAAPPFDAVFDRHFDAIHGYLRRRVGDAGEDLAAETFTRALAGWSGFDAARADVRPWLFGIATNVVHATDALREGHVPPRVRRALIGALGLTPGVQTLGVKRDSRGREGLAFARRDDFQREEAIFDMRTYTLLEETSRLVDARGAPGGEIKVGDVIGSAVYLERNVVDSVP